jgi:hypothetical protein
MNKKVIVLGIIFLFIIVGFTGCNEESNNSENNPIEDEGNNNIDNFTKTIEIFNVSVKTKWWDGFANGERGEADGFYHDYPEKYDESGNSVWYEINGDVKNNDTIPIKSIKITATFYDNSGNNLYEKSDYVYNLNIGEIGYLTIKLTRFEDFKYITDYELDYLIIND